MNKLFKQFTPIIKLLSIIILVVIQITLMPYMAIYGTWPNLILLLALVLIIFGATTESFLVASLGGLILDLASSLFFGFFTIVLMILIFMAKILVSKYLNEATVLISGIILTLTAVIFDSILSLVVHHFSIIQILVNSVYSLVLGLVFYFVLRRYLHRQNIRV